MTDVPSVKARTGDDHAACTTTAADVRAALRSHWTESEYLHLNEAPQDADRSGRKLDVLVISQWRSRGHQLDGVEIKVSMSDWKRELDNAKKADWWFQHVHRFWIACPVSMAAKVRLELPPAWGLLAVDSGTCKPIVKAPVHNATPFTWETMVGLLRAAADSGPAALQRQFNAGLNEGIERGKKEALRRDVEGRAQAELDDLRGKLRTFLDAAGLSRWEVESIDDAAQWGPMLAAVRSWQHYPNLAIRRIEETAAKFADEARRITTMSAGLRAALQPIEEAHSRIPREVGDV